MSAPSPGMGLVLEPPPPWSVTAESSNDIRRRTLEGFGLDPIRPVVVVGHQPLFWHPGILAKFLAADALARRCDAQLVHLVLDGHRGDFGLVNWPRAGDDGTISVGEWRFRAAESEVPMGLQPACTPYDVPEDSSEMLRPRWPSCSSHACALSALHTTPWPTGTCAS